MLKISIKSNRKRVFNSTAKSSKSEKIDYAIITDDKKLQKGIKKLISKALTEKTFSPFLISCYIIMMQKRKIKTNKIFRLWKIIRQERSKLNNKENRNGKKQNFVNSEINDEILIELDINIIHIVSFGAFLGMFTNIFIK